MQGRLYRPGSYTPTRATAASPSQERNTLEACAHTKTITIPGTSYFIPNEEPERVAACITEALGHELNHAPAALLVEARDVRDRASHTRPETD